MACVCVRVCIYMQIVCMFTQAQLYAYICILHSPIAYTAFQS